MARMGSPAARRRRRRAVLLAVAGTAALAAAVVGGSPVDAASGGAPWRVSATPPSSGDVGTTLLQSVAAVSPGEAFAVGWTRHDLPGVYEWRTLVERWSAGGWQVMPTPDLEAAPAKDFLYGVAGSSPRDVWAVGAGTPVSGTHSAALALHYDGVSWAIVPVPEPTAGVESAMSAVVSLSTDDVWAVGSSYSLDGLPAVFHWDGRAWTSRVLPRPQGCTATNNAELTAVTATASGEVYAGGVCPTAQGRRAFVLRRNGDDWPVVARGGVESDVYAMTSTPSGEVWAVGSQSVRAVGQSRRGFALHGSGTAWQRLDRPAVDLHAESFTGVAATSAGVTVVGSAGPLFGPGTRPEVLTWTSGGWLRSPVTPAPSTDAWMTSVAAWPGGRVWGLGQAFDARSRLVPVSVRPVGGVVR